ncbi:hypothetical protein, partial [Bacillus sp. SG-1]|uniref:hypothetical protein n=1 Tax=Bacillus sp. SG-1 TaxID=161544 RepID=UPI0001544775
FYFSEKTEAYLKEAVLFNDPKISTTAAVICIDKNIEVSSDILEKHSTNVESAGSLYWGLAEKNKEHLFPVKEKQPVLAKSHLFSYLVMLSDEEGEPMHIFPEDIKVVDRVDTVNSYGQPLRYYFMSYLHGEEVLTAWVGGYVLEEEDDSAEMWEGTFTDFEPLDVRTIEEHKELFLKKREEDLQESEQAVHFESSPRLSKGLWFFYALLIGHWSRVFYNGIDEEIYISVAFTIIGGLLTLFELWRKKRRRVAIVGRELVKERGKQKESIPFHEIKKVLYDKKRIKVYNKRDELQLTIPLRWVDYDTFYIYLVEHTGHLREQPYIEE